jgi:hypothetical protein
MRFEFYLPGPSPEDGSEPPPPQMVGSASWDGSRVTIDADDPTLRTALEHAFRATPVVTDDASYRRFGTHGEMQIQPGDLEWFRAAAQVRATAEAGVTARLVPGVTEGGFDPAAGYRTFEESIERLRSNP